jgi:transcriptional repressor NrdR
MSIRRRRECDDCQGRFTTHERLEDFHLLVIKRDGSRELFDREKLRQGIGIACRKRPVTADQIDQTVEGVERALLKRGERELPAGVIGEEVLKCLFDLDSVAYLRFASVYQDFRDLEAFRDALDALLRERKSKPIANVSLSVET